MSRTKNGLLGIFMPAFVIGLMHIMTNNNGSLVLSSPILNHSKWIVLTSISPPTEDVKKLVKIENWKVVVVGDNKSPSNWSFPDAVFLSVEDQLQLGFKIAKLLPYNSYTRKMIGYLYAMKNGAKYIYDTDDDNHPTDGNIDFHFEANMSGLIYDDLSQNIMNPLPHFGQPDLWPRGYLLESIPIQPNNSYRLCTFTTPAIQQGLVNGDPDVDAIYRLINKGASTTKTINITFDDHAPPLVLPKGVFAPFNSQNTFFFYQAFWALYLPSTVAFRVTDIWRGYWAQKLLWLTGQYLAFFPPNAIQYRNSHSYLKDFEEEIQLYEGAGKFVNLLSKWECQSNSSFFKCVKELSLAMVKENIWENREYELIEAWIEDLINVGYKEPPMVNLPLEKMCLDDEKYYQVYYSNPGQKAINNGYKDLFDFCEVDFLKNNISIAEFANDLEPKSTPKNVSYSFDNILLVVVFNYPYLGNVRFLEALYRDHFPNMLFCSEAKNYAHLMAEINSGFFPWRKNDVSFVNVTSTKGYYGYECAIRALEMHYKVDGYLFLADDLLFRPWKIKSFNFQTSKIQNDIAKPILFTNKTAKAMLAFSWWQTQLGYISTNRVFDEIESLAKKSSKFHNNPFQTFIKNRYASELNMSLVVINMSDMYYISSNDSWLLSQILKVFHQENVFLEIAVPTAFSGSRIFNNQSALNDDGFLGISIWANQRNTPMKYLKSEFHYIHPLKFTELKNQTNLLRDYCLGYIHDYLKNW